MASLPSVVDIGVNPLDAPPYLPMLQAGSCTVFGFEPQLEAINRLQETKGPSETYENTAIGDGCEHEFNTYRGSGLSSLYALDPKFMAFLDRYRGSATLLEKTTVKTRRLDDISELKRIDLLKIDVQGAEAMIFKNGSEKLSSAVAVVTELRFYPLYENEPLLDAQISQLSDLGLRFHKFLFVKNQMVSSSQANRLKKRLAGSQALDGDAVFVRDLRNPETVTVEQLKALALISDAVFESCDLTLHCLDLLVSSKEITGTAPEEYVNFLPPSLRKRR